MRLLKTVGRFFHISVSHHIVILSNSEILPQPGPFRLSICDYLARQRKRKEATLARIPRTENPKHRRGGKIVKLQRLLADLKSRTTMEHSIRAMYSR